jgi:hypothetical protein
MKLKLHNGTYACTNLEAIAGGFDPDLGKVVLVVKGDAGVAGTILFDASEAVRIGAMLATTPPVKRVGSIDDATGIVVEHRV